jgi:two-component sensor histidine kinase
MSASRTPNTTFRQLLFLLACVWLGAVLFVALSQISGMLTLRGFSPEPLGRIRYFTLFIWLPWLAFGPFVAGLAQRMPIRPDRWLKPLSVNLLALLVMAVLHGLGAGYYYHYFGDMTPEMATYAPWQHAGHYLFGDNMLLFDIILYAVLAASFNLGNFHRLLRRQELDAIRLRETLAELRLQTLRMQINPHFLFNSLNAVTTLIYKNESDRAVETINRIASFFRRTLEGTGEQWVRLEHELEMVHEYLAIAQVRYGQRLNVIEASEPSMSSVSVPAMLLQPLIENAIVHGIGEKPGPRCVAVRCHQSQDRLIIEISDDGAGSRLHEDPNFQEGIGLTNVRLRLQQLYGDEHAFSIKSKLGAGTTVTISLPISPPGAGQVLPT